jgi:Restriction endonuclease
MNSNESARSCLPPKIDIDPLFANLKGVQERRASCLRELQDATSERNSLSRSLTAIRLQLAYYKWADRTRLAVARTIGLRIGAAMILGTVTGSIAVVITESPILAAIGAILGGLGSAALLYWPRDDRLVQGEAQARATLADLTRQRKDCVDGMASLQSRLSNLGSRLRRLEAEIQEAQEINSVQARREELVRMNWKAMRGPELENFLAIVFAELGYQVQHIGAAGDQGADLIAIKQGHRIAVQSKGYVDSVSNGAVQEAFAGMTFHGCHRCVVITNSRFTSSAWELARRTQCVLIDENTLPAFIRGDIDLVPSDRDGSGVASASETVSRK